MKRTLIISALAILALVVFTATRDRKPRVTRYSDAPALSQNVSSSEGKQFIDISAKGGYEPRLTVAKANVPTVIRVKTNATFDCSSALRIPALKYSKNLPPTGTTDIELPAQAAGTTLKALCSMGMYNFSISFQG